MKQYIYTLLIITLVCVGLHGNAQVSAGGTPVSVEMGLPRNNFPTLNLEPFDVKAMEAEDAINFKNKTVRSRFGKRFSVNLGLDNAGSWNELPNGDRIWRQGIYSPGALTINMIFGEFYMPEGATLFIYNFDQSSMIGAFTEINNKEHGKLGTTVVQGDRMVVEYYEPAAVRGLGKVRIETVVHAYRDVFAIKSTDAYGQSGTCNVNINCPMGQPWQKEKRGVAVIIDGAEICTGALINNVKQDGTPFFLTANHCYAGPPVATVGTWVFGFNWESKTCTNANPGASNAQSVSGSTWKANNAGSDFCLLQLSETPPLNYNTYMNGWSYAVTKPTSAACIHHPSGDIKKISVSNTVSSSTMSGAACWGIIWAQNTTTEPGSSGSPLFDQNHRIVGQLYGGGASCTNLTAMDNYGRFNVSWATGTTSSTRLKDWLDPLGTTTGTIDGIETRCTAAPLTLPFSETFEAVATNQIPKSWSKLDTLGTASSWIMRTTGAAGSRKSMQAKNFGVASGAINKLLLPNFNARGFKNIKIKFSYAYAQADSSKGDTLALMVKTGCDDRFIKVWSRGGTRLATVPGLITGAFTPTTPAMWITDSVTLDSRFDNVRFFSLAITNLSAGGNNIWVDNIQLLASVAPIPPTPAFSSALTKGCEGLQVTFRDASLLAPNTWNWSFPGGNPSTSTAQNPVVTYPTAGQYDVKLVVSNANGSDSLLIPNYVAIFGTPTAALPLSDDFETPGLSNWKIVKNGSDSAWRQYTGIGANGSTSCLVASNFKDLTTGTNSALISPAFDLSLVQNAKIKFNYAYALFNRTSYDSLGIAYSTDCGVTFKRFYAKGGRGLSTVTQTTEFFPTAASWKSDSVNVPAAIANSTSVKFAFINYCYSGQDLYLDNINISSRLTGVDGRVISQLELYPNPTSGYVNVVLNSTTNSPVKMSVVDVLGKEIQSQNVDKGSQVLNHRLDISTLPAGLYFVKITQSGQTITRQISKSE